MYKHAYAYRYKISTLDYTLINASYALVLLYFVLAMTFPYVVLKLIAALSVIFAGRLTALCFKSVVAFDNAAKISILQGKLLQQMVCLEYAEIKRVVVIGARAVFIMQNGKEEFEISLDNMSTKHALLLIDDLRLNHVEVFGVADKFL